MKPLMRQADLRRTHAPLNEIAKGERAITADTALRLGRYFGMAPEFWLNLQSHYDLELEQDLILPADFGAKRW